MTRALAALLLWVLAPCSPAAFVPLVEQATVFPAPANHWSGGMRTVLGARKDRSGGGLGRGRLGSATPLDTRAEPPFPPANKHQRQFWSNGGLLYVPQLLSPVEWEEVRAAASSLNSKMSAETSSFASGRRMLTLTRRKTGGAYDAILRPFQTARVAEKLEAVSGINGIHLSDHPAELRLYTPGAFMEWHQDDQLLPMPQLEAVYTIKNEGDSVTQWRDVHGEMHEKWTEPNSLILVLAGGAPHRVQPMKRGQRLILKLLYART